LRHRDYTEGVNSAETQHNIVAFVGNGFDLQVAKDYGMQIDTKFSSFYHYLKLRSFDEDNTIVRGMETLRSESDENWSDVEEVVQQLLDTSAASPSDLRSSLQSLQSKFSEFLNLAVPTSILEKLGQDSMDEGLAISSLQEFLGDLKKRSYKKLEFPKRIYNYDLFNFLFVNFNYTSLLDDFIYLDQQQFDPLPYKTSGVDRNFKFHIDPLSGGKWGDSFSSYVVTETVHPHGYQSIPRSLLFGIDHPDSKLSNQDPILRLSKPFWAQNNIKYNAIFKDTELFIIFGCSLGKSDRWWWRSIADSLQKGFEDGVGNHISPELIIYWYDPSSRPVTPGKIREKFLNFANDFDSDKISQRIHVIVYNSDTRRKWLNTRIDKF